MKVYLTVYLEFSMLTVPQYNANIAGMMLIVFYVPILLCEHANFC